MKSDENMVFPLCCSLDSRSLGRYATSPPCEILNTDTKENSGQPLGMRKGINSDRLRTISRAKMRNTIAVLQNKKKKIETFI